MVDLGGAALEWRGDGGVELVGVQVGRRRCSGAWGGGIGKRAKGKEGGGPPGFNARERRGRRPLTHAVHGGVAVAAGGSPLGAWQGEERARREAKAVEEVQRDAWAVAKLELACGRSTAAGAAPLSAGGVEQRASRLEEWEKD